MRKVEVAGHRARLARRHRLAPKLRAGDVAAARSTVCLRLDGVATPVGPR